MTNRVLILLLISILSHSICSSADNQSLFQKANISYQKGNFNDAIIAYEDIVRNNGANSTVYFNLGNAYFRTNKLAYAILNYERAKKINPDDDEVNFNLNVVNMKIVDKINPIPKYFLTQWMDNLNSKYSSNFWAGLSIFSISFACIMYLGFIYFYTPNLKKITFLLGLIGIVISIVFIIFASQSFSYENTKDEAIITLPSIYVKSSPSEKTTDLFILHEGTKFKIMEKMGNWTKIRLADGKVGWIFENGFELI